MPRKTREKTAAPFVPTELVQCWASSLAADDRSAHTVRAYRSAVLDFLGWYEREEQRPLALDDLTPIALIGYRNHLQHDQRKATSTVNTRVAALRAWCAWLVEQGHVAVNPASRLKTVGRQVQQGAQRVLAGC